MNRSSPYQGSIPNDVEMVGVSRSPRASLVRVQSTPGLLLNINTPEEWIRLYSNEWWTNPGLPNVKLRPSTDIWSGNYDVVETETGQGISEIIEFCANTTTEQFQRCQNLLGSYNKMRSIYLVNQLSKQINQIRQKFPSWTPNPFIEGRIQEYNRLPLNEKVFYWRNLNALHQELLGVESDLLLNAIKAIQDFLGIQETEQKQLLDQVRQLPVSQLDLIHQHYIAIKSAFEKQQRQAQDKLRQTETNCVQQCNAQLQMVGKQLQNANAKLADIQWYINEMNGVDTEYAWRNLVGVLSLPPGQYTQNVIEKRRKQGLYP